MSDRTGVPREARTLSGRDVGREIWSEGHWWKVEQIIHRDGGLTFIHLLRLSGTGMDAPTHTLVLAPTDTVTIRGRDE